MAILNAIQNSSVVVIILLLLIAVHGAIVFHGYSSRNHRKSLHKFHVSLIPVYFMSKV